jgi:hypothetical protein
MQSTGANQEQKADKSINQNKHGSVDQTFDISNGDDSWDNRISKVLKSQKKHLCENHNCQINNVGFMSKEELIEHTMRMHCCIKPGCFFVI